ncbi:nucleoside recognition domain-containing protein [Halalkalibacter akibai]|uniref:Nucleoside binding-domain containing protein n=1 Tax=Halalkalibacter akibai (strain ATCC 43226 / DSM 21942 / CIP 109018 / JCM 9157 / 1139) TaxID=1236973 RepID=W4QMH4_HALA3|nr:nucleoside recognition domain-containing protein [Halalkalibacter akibai]GAE33097.1 nucleoside binding-domain containing protein [Halalkalibacter akibai JCM 9157]
MGMLKRGLLVGLKTTWMLGKIIFPITLIVTILGYTPVLQWIAGILAPLMSWIGLPGEAAIPLVLGNALNLYAAIGAILTLELTVKEVFILAVMLSFSHAIILESAVAHKVGIRIWVVLVVRCGLAIVSALLINWLWDGGQEIAQYGFVSNSGNEVIEGWLAIAWQGVMSASLGIIQLAIIVIPLMMFIQIMKEKNWLAFLSKAMRPLTKMLGIKENTSTTLASGLFFGLSFGAGVMIQAVKEDGVKKKDLYLAFIFLVACHAVVEDTLIFIPLGIPILPLLIIRVVTAILLTVAIAYVWRRVEKKQQLEEGKEASYEH